MDPQTEPNEQRCDNAAAQLGKDLAGAREIRFWLPTQQWQLWLLVQGQDHNVLEE